MPASSTGLPVAYSAQAVVRNMTIGAITSYDARKKEDWERQMDEYDCQVKVPVQVPAVGAVPVWLPFEVGFTVYFIAPLDNPKRETPYDDPIFTWGCRRIGKFRFFVMVNLLEWVGHPAPVSPDDDSKGITGARMEVGIMHPAVHPGEDKKYNCELELHLNFQGYGGAISDLDGVEGES
jgi:hypothetical protein